MHLSLANITSDWKRPEVLRVMVLRTWAWGGQPWRNWTLYLKWASYFRNHYCWCISLRKELRGNLSLIKLMISLAVKRQHTIECTSLSTLFTNFLWLQPRKKLKRHFHHFFFFFQITPILPSSLNKTMCPYPSPSLIQCCFSLRNNEYNSGFTRNKIELRGKWKKP